MPNTNNELIQGYQRFARKDDHGLYQKLLAGQHPHTLLFSCSDSRIVPEEIFDAKPGEIFVLRNVGNLALTDNASIAAAIDYAVGHLQVKRVVVLAHQECGAVKACLDKSCLHEKSLRSWLDQETYDGEDITAAIKAAGLRQLRRLEEYPLVHATVAQGDLAVELYYFHLADRSLLQYCDGQWIPQGRFGDEQLKING